MRWGVVIVAGGFAPASLSAELGTERKALAQFGGKTSLEWTIDAVREAGIEDCVTVGGEDVRGHVRFGEWQAERGSAVDNFSAGVEVLRTKPEALLPLPSDSPLLTAEMLRHFMASVEQRAAEQRWYAAGLSSLRDFSTAYPGVAAKSTRTREGRFLTGALYALASSGLPPVLDLVHQIRHSRKSQFAVARRLGLANMLLMLSGRASLANGEQALARAFGGQIIIVPDCHPATCFDFDDPAEYRALVKFFPERP